MCSLQDEIQLPAAYRGHCRFLISWPQNSTLILCSRLLARHPKVLEKLRSEIESTVGLGKNAQDPSRNDLKKMTYLNLVIKEGKPCPLYLG